MYWVYSGSRYIHFYLVWNDWCFVDNYIHKAEDISPTFQIQEGRSMPMHNAAFGQNINGDSLLTRHDLSVEFNSNVDFSLFFLRSNWKVNLNFRLATNIDKMVMISR